MKVKTSFRHQALSMRSSLISQMNAELEPKKTVNLRLPFYPVKLG